MCCNWRGGKDRIGHPTIPHEPVPLSRYHVVIVDTGDVPHTGDRYKVCNAAMPQRHLALESWQRIHEKLFSTLTVSISSCPHALRQNPSLVMKNKHESKHYGNEKSTLCTNHKAALVAPTLGHSILWNRAVPPPPTPNTNKKDRSSGR